MGPWRTYDTLLPGDGADAVQGGSGSDHVVILDLCEVVAGESIDGGTGYDTLWLPDGVLLADVLAAGATVTSIELVKNLSGGAWGTAECAL